MSLTSVIRYIRAQDTSSSTGVGKTGLAFGDFTAKYLTQAGTLTSLTTETITTLGTYQAPTSSAHIRIKELANTDPSKGIYEVHFHNTQMVDTGQKLWLFLSATGAAIPPLEVELLPFKADLLQILGTTLTETSAGYLAAAFKKLFDVAAPVLTTASVNQTGDSYGIVNSGTYGNSALKTLIDAISTLIGALNASASSGDPGTTTNLVQYLKQIINTLEGKAGIPAWPAAAAPGNAVSLAEAIHSIYTQIGVAGAGLTNVGDTRMGNLDAAVSSRMATYTQPTGFLATTFPAGTVASTTNITGGTITTVTTLTNDPTGVTTLLSRLSATRAGYLDNLSAGAVATAANLATVAGYIDTEVADIRTRVLLALPAFAAGTSGGLATYDEQLTAANSLSSIQTDTAGISGIASDLTTTQGTVNSINAKLGSISGAGNNTVLGYFVAIASKDASTPSDWSGTYVAGTDSLEANAADNFLNHAVDEAETGATIAACLNAARAQGFGKWAIVGTTLNLYASNGTTIVKSFTLDSDTAPTSRS